MRATGRTLFGRPGFREAYGKLVNRSVRDAVFACLLQNPEATRLQLRAAAMEEAIILSPALLTSDLKTSLSAAEAWPGGMSCTIPFFGEAALFFYCPPVWPPARPTRGTVSSDGLVLSATGLGDERRWLPAVLASELAEIERLLAAQHAAFAFWDRELGRHVRGLIGRVYPRISPTLIASLGELITTMAVDEPSTMFARSFIERQRSELWLAWAA